jgi:hypothetical protein
MIVVIVMMFCVVLVAVGGYLFLNQPQEGDECEAKNPDDNALSYEIDADGKCVLKSCKSGYIKSGQKCIVEEEEDDDTYTIPTDDASNANCYGARYVDLRAAFGTDAAALENHYTTYTTNGSENRDNSCTLNDGEAQCYIDRYADAKTFAGTDLEKGRKHYYETGMAENRDFTCPPAIKELKCYGERYPDLQNAFGTDWDARGGNSTLYKLNTHWNNHGKGENRDFSCP